jgi:hypothetical protein
MKGIGRRITPTVLKQTRRQEKLSSAPHGTNVSDGRPRDLPFSLKLTFLREQDYLGKPGVCDREQPACDDGRSQRRPEFPRAVPGSTQCTAERSVPGEHLYVAAIAINHGDFVTPGRYPSRLP